MNRGLPLSTSTLAFTSELDSENADGPDTPSKPLDARTTRQAVVRQALAAGVASVAWMTVSSALIVLNKHIISQIGFAYPMALSGLGMAFSAAASFMVCKVFKWVHVKRPMTLRYYATGIMPVGLCMAFTLQFGNIVYLYLTMSFIQILKAFTPIITMAALAIAGMETPTVRLMAALLLITVGTAMASYGELAMSWTGVACMLASECFEATRLVLTQMLLVGHSSMHPIEGLMYLAPACVFWLLIGVALVEWPAMQQNNAMAMMVHNPTIFAAAAVLGFAVNSLAYSVIQLSSSLTLKVISTVKNAVVVWIGIIVFQELVTLLQAGGYLVSVLGFAWYNHLKLQQQRSPQAATKPAGEYTPVPQQDSSDP